MAKKKKYDDDMLLNAIVRYSETVPGKIVLTELAAWTAVNIPGMEDVREHCFRVTETVTDPRTGKKSQKPRAPYERIRQINAERSLSAAIRSDSLLRSSDPDDFLRESKTEQRRQILEARKKVEQLVRDCSVQNSRIDALTAENRELKAANEALNELLERIAEEQAVLERNLSLLAKVTGEARMREAMASIGVADGGFDLEKYASSLHEKVGEAFSVKKATAPATAVSDLSRPAGSGFVRQAELTEEIMKGIDF